MRYFNKLDEYHGSIHLSGGWIATTQRTIGEPPWHWRLACGGLEHDGWADSENEAELAALDTYDAHEKCPIDENLRDGFVEALEDEGGP